jgi:type IV pilus biogenesis protein CpaD/CtpE
VKRVHRLGARVLAGALPSLLAACASTPPAAAWSPELAPSTLETTSPAEAAVLERAAQLPVDEPVDVSGLRVVAAAPYSAASGRLCRELQLDDQLRLACSGDEGWVFVPVLLEGP